MIQRMFVTLDTKKTNYKNVGKINHGDDLILEITVLSDGDMISFNDPMVDLLVKKSDGKMIRQNSGIEHIQPNKFIIEVKKDCVTSPGLATNQLVINDNGRISTCMFYYTILNSLEEDIIQSISSVEVLEQLDEYVIEAHERMEMLNNDINELEELFGATSDKLIEAEMARNEAEQNRVQSEILRVNNENDRIEADNIRNQNEVDRLSSELVREQRESERILNEEERRQNESERMMDENTRQSNESIRMINETDRKTQENRRVTAEINRVNAETTRRNNENSRISNEIERQKTIKEMKSLIDEAEQNENARQSNESIRMSNEFDRKTQENSRVTAETNRVTAETNRVTAETNRVTAETNRVNAETTRRNNENSRISNETERQKTIEEMKRLIDEADGFDDVYDSKIDFFGKEHDKLSTRLNADFDNVHQRINESELLPYEGANIKADNTYYGLQKDTVVKGRTLQNLVKTNAPRDIRVEKDNMIGCTSRELSIFNKPMIKAGSNYTIIFNVKELTCEFKMAIRERPDHPDRQYITLAKAGESGVIIKTITVGNFIINDFFLFINEVDFQNGEVASISDVILLEGDHTQTPLEELPYIEGIESVGDKNKNLFYGEFEEGQINTQTGEEIAYNGRCRSVQYVNIEPNKTYTVSMTQNVVSAPWTSVRLYKDNTYIKTVQASNGISKFTFESGEANRLRVTANIPYNDVINCQIEEGTQVTPYQEHYDGYKISGKSCGNNLCDNSKNKITEINSNTGVESVADKMIVSDYIRINGKKPYIRLLIDNQEYYTNAAYSYRYYDENKNYIGSDSSLYSKATYFRVRYLSHQVVLNVSDIKFMVTLDGFKDYEPYQESNYSYILNEPLRSLPNGVCDEIDLTTGVLTRRVKRVVLNGSEEWKIQSTDTNGNGLVNFSLNNNFKRRERDNSICDRFPIGLLIADEKSESHLFGQQTLYIRKFISSNITTVSAFKEWLQANPTTVYYELAEPTTEQLTPQQLKSFDPTTHIISDNKLMPVVSTKIPSNVQAIISTLKLENSDLKNNVEVLSVENEELKETNIVQDEMIDISMMATDEMYSMLEPLLENIPMPMKFEEGVSKLAYMYVAMVQRGLKTLDEVPTRYREQVRAMIQYN